MKLVSSLLLMVLSTSSFATIDRIIDSKYQDKDIIFQGNDGGSIIEAARFDISAGGLFGINTSTPTELLEIRDDSNDAVIRIHRGGSAEYKLGIDSGSTDFRIGSSNGDVDISTIDALVVASNGDVSMNNELIFVPLANTLRPVVNAGLDLGATGTRWSVAYTVNQTTTNAENVDSDLRYKTNIEKSDLGLDFILKLNPVKYNKHNAKEKEYGLIAQQVKVLLKGDESLLHHDSEIDRYSLAYSQLIAPLIKAVQEQQATIETLKLKVAELEGQ